MGGRSQSPTGSRRVALGLLAGLMACAGCTESAPDVCRDPAAASARRPSFVVIVADTLRADYVGRGGEGRSLTPALDRFEDEAVAFRAAFAQAPWTKPSVASLLTGLHPPAHGVMDHGGRFFGDAGAPPHATVLPGEVTTLAEALDAAGYDAAAFVANEWLALGYGFEQGFDYYATLPRAQQDAVFERAEQWLAERDGSRPFFVYVHTMHVHGPYDAPESVVELARASEGFGPSLRLDDAQLEAIPEYLRGPAWTHEERARDLREWRTRYAAGVRAFDTGFGAFLERATRAGWLEDVVLVVAADHGEELFDHGGWNHGATLFDEQLHVPFTVRLPGGRGGGRRVDSIVSLVDLTPTLVDQAGLPALPARHGRSLVPILCGDAPPAADGRSFATASNVDPDLHALRTDRYKLVLDARSGANELFDLQRDPAEQRDLALEQRETAEALARELRRHVDGLERERRATPAAAVPADMAERLEALGYSR